MTVIDHTAPDIKQIH